MTLEELKQRVDSLLKQDQSDTEDPTIINSLYHGTLTVLEAVYGPRCTHILELQEVHKEILGRDRGNRNIHLQNLRNASRGALTNLKEELEGGLVGSMQKRLIGEVLTDFIQLAKFAINQNDENSKNVAAVLAAAAYEDTIRRMGVAYASIVNGEDLQKVLITLKDKQLLVGPQFSTAQGFLTFRNHALHANWNKLDRPEIQSVLAFVEELLLKHFQ